MEVECNSYQGMVKTDYCTQTGFTVTQKTGGLYPPPPLHKKIQTYLHLCCLTKVAHELS